MTRLIFLLSSLCSLCLCGSYSSAADPERTTPYKVDVVVRFAENRLLTPVFRRQVVSELQEGLHAALGAMGQVQVVDLATVPADRRPPLWQDVEAKGLQQALDARGRPTSDVKTHFLVVDYVDGQYEVQSRQFDGLTGRASDAVRRERTPDRLFVARAAALLVDRDFGVVGTITEATVADRARVVFKGGGLGVPVTRWVKKGDLFAVVQMAGGRAAEMRYTLLRATTDPDEQGGCLCEVFQPRQKVLNDADYRCIKLGTVKGPLRLRIQVDPPGATAVASLGVVARHEGFGRGPYASGQPDKDGFFSTERSKNIALFDGLAFVEVQSGAQTRAQVPVAVTSDRPIALRVTVDPTASSQTNLLRRFWEEALAREQAAQIDLFKRLNGLLKPETRKEALETAQRGLTQLDKDLDNYDKELKNLQNEGVKADLLAAGETRLAELKKGQKELQTFLKTLEGIIAEENDPARQEAKTTLEKARLLEEREANFPAAVELYEKVLAVKDDAALRARVVKLKGLLETKDDKLRDARRFLFDVWPQEADAKTLAARTEEAKKMFAVCRDAKDPLGPRRLVKAAEGHAVRLARMIGALSPDVNEDDEKPAKELGDIADKLTALVKEAAAFVKATPLP